MKVAFLIRVLAVCAVGAGAFAYGSWIWRVRGEAGTRLRKAETLDAQSRALRADLAAAVESARGLRQALTEASNRIDEVEARLEEEKSTHDPLRRQIETMLSEQIALQEALKQKEAALKDNGKGLASARQAADELLARKTALEARVAQVEAELKSAHERNAALQSRATEAQALADRLKARLDEVLQRLEASERAAAETNQVRRGEAGSASDAGEAEIKK